MSLRMSAVVWLFLFSVYAHGAPAAFYFEDSPELITCAVILGNAHDPGYPLHALLGRLAMLLPLGTPTLRFGLLMAALGGGSAVALGMVTARLARRASMPAAAGVAGSITALGWGLSDTAWWQCVIGEKYALMYLAFSVLLAVSLNVSRADGRKGERGALMLAVLLGGAVVCHYYALFAAPAAVWAWCRRAGASGHRVGRTIPLCLLFALLPISIRFLYPPIRAEAGAPLNWGRPATAGSLARSLTGARYYRPAARASLEVRWRRGRLPARGWTMARRTQSELSWLHVVGIPIGILAAMTCRLGEVALIGACGVFNAAYVLNFSEKTGRWLVPFIGTCFVLSGFGWTYLTLTALRRLPATAWRAALAGVALLTIGHQVERNGGRNDLGTFYAAHDMGRNLLISLPTGSVYLGAGDVDLFPCWALKIVEGLRPDVIVVGLNAFLDRYPADVGGLDQVKAAYGIGWRGADALLALMKHPRNPP